MARRATNISEKIIPSAINVLVVFTISSPFIFLWGFGLSWKLAIIAIFFVYNLVFALFNDNRCPGMIVAKTYWQKDFILSQKLVYTVIYTLSFSTIFFWLFFPFDLLLANLLLVQLPMVLAKDTTLHAYLSGNNKTIKQNPGA